MESEEKLLLENKVLELENKLLEITKENAVLKKEIQESEDKIFEGEVKNKVDALVLSRKIKSGDIEKENKFALSIGRDLAEEYFANLKTRDDVIDTTILSKNGVETGKAKESKKTE